MLRPRTLGAGVAAFGSVDVGPASGRAPNFAQPAKNEAPNPETI